MAKILIVEDEPGIVEVMKEFFAIDLPQHQVFDARTIADARRMVQEHPDLAVITMDGTVPLESGGKYSDTIALVGEIRALGYTGPIIACSANKNSELMAAGCAYEFGKPPLLHHLTRLVGELIASKEEHPR